jgi:MPBQ/MSBQ methyltransferase
MSAASGPAGGGVGTSPGNAVEAQVAKHYTTGELEERILRAFEANGKSRASLTLADLSAVDEFHVGGREASESVASKMNLRPGMRLLDVGSGIGGTARYFSAGYQCDVTGIDLTAEFVQTAQALTQRVAPNLPVRFQQGSALELPFADASFDGAYLFHVGMNIAEKSKLFAEIRRAVHRGGGFALFDFMRTGDGEFAFPVPWAGDISESFLATPKEYRDALTAQGFSVRVERDRRQFAIEFIEQRLAPAAQQGPPPPGVGVLMGASAPVKLGNVLDGLRRGVFAPFELITEAV